MAQANGEACIEGIAAAAGAFDRDIEGRHLETRAVGMMIIGAVPAQREHAALDAEIDEDTSPFPSCPSRPVRAWASSIDGMK